MFNNVNEMAKRLYFSLKGLQDSYKFLSNKLKARTDMMAHEAKLNELKLKEKSILLVMLSEEVGALRRAAAQQVYQPAAPVLSGSDSSGHLKKVIIASLSIYISISISLLFL